MLRFCLAFSALSTLLAALAPAPLVAQASRTASKSADVAVFGGFEAAHPDYGPYNSYGGFLGADFTRYLPLPVEPSLEFRANFHSNVAVSENTYVAGLRLAAPFYRIKPYVDFLVGPGDIHFKGVVGYTHDNSLVYNYGGGIDFQVMRNIAAKLDFQAQHWNTGTDTYTPTIGAVGVTYTIPFRSRVGR